MDLVERRGKKADSFFEQSDLIGLKVEDANGWEQYVPGRELFL